MSGILAPLASFMITEMPASAILPYIMLELAVIGALSGLLSKRSYPAILRVLFVQICAKAIRIAVFAAGFAISNGTAPSASTLFGDVVISLPGVALQLIVLTLVLMSKEIKNAK